MKNQMKQFTLRIPEEVFEQTKEEADRIGSSHNSYILNLIDLGRKISNAKKIIIQED